MSPAEDAALVLQDQPPERTHELGLLAQQLEEPLPPELLQLQLYAVEARYEQGPFTLRTPRQKLLAELEVRLAALERRLG